MSSLQRELTLEHCGGNGVCRLEDHPRRHPRHEPESVDRRSARAGQPRSCSACRIRSSARSLARRRSAIRRFPAAQLMKPFPQYTTVSLYRNNVGTTIYQGFYAKLEQRFSRGLSYLVSYTRSTLKDDASSVFDASILTGPVANFPVADSFNRQPRARLLDRRHPPRVRRRRRCGTFPSGRAGASAVGCRRRDRERLDRDRHPDAAVGRSDRGRAGDKLERVRRVRDAAAESRRRSGHFRADERSVSGWFDTAPS